MGVLNATLPCLTSRTLGPASGDAWTSPGSRCAGAPTFHSSNRCSIICGPSAPSFRDPEHVRSSLADGSLRRAPLPHQLLLPRRRLGRRRARRPGGRARVVGARGHRSPGPLRGGPVRDRRPRGRDPPGHRARARARSTRSSRIPAGIVVPARRPTRRGGPARLVRRLRRGRPLPATSRSTACRSGRGPSGRGCRVIGTPSRRTCAAIGEGQRGPHLVLLARDRTGYRSLCRLVSRANLAGTKGVPRFTQALLAEHAEGLVALSGCRDGEIARRLRVGDRDGARIVAEGYARLFGSRPGRSADDRDRRRRLRARARAPPPARRRLARGRDGPAGRGARPAGRRHERRPLRPARGPRAPGRPDGDPPRPDGRDAGRSPPTRRRVLPQVRRGAAARFPRPTPRRRSTIRGRPGPGRRASRTPASWRPPARSTSGSRPIASRASRCPAARRRSRTSPSCATRAPGGATTR